MNDTKLKGDIAELSIQIKALKRGFKVLKPLGDRLPYDMAFDLGKKFLKIQVKSAWNKGGKKYQTDCRRCKTNRKVYKIERYEIGDFDFAIVYIEDLDVTYIFPSRVFNSYGSSISLNEDPKYTQDIRSREYREAWHLLV